MNRLNRRLRRLQLASYKDYADLVEVDKTEQQLFIDAITTNETAFFRESKHFNYIYEMLQQKPRSVDCWCAAASTGEEVYTLALTFASALENKPYSYSILGTDINVAVLQTARLGRYPMGRRGEIPEKLLKKYCLRGINEEEGYFTFNNALKKNIEFRRLNLVKELPARDFDMVFLRNIMIYFDAETKKHVIKQVMKRMKKEGYLFIGQAEHLTQYEGLKRVEPSIFQKI